MSRRIRVLHEKDEVMNMAADWDEVDLMDKDEHI
jgi:hypothetical protein